MLAIELYWFVVAPIVSEAGQWWRRRHRLRVTTRTVATAVWTATLVLLLMVPWQSRVVLPAVMRAAAYAAVYPPTAARLEAVAITVGQPVRAGTVLFQLGLPQLDFQLAQIADRITLIDTLIRRQEASGQGTTQLTVLREELATSLATRDGLRALTARLTIRAPLDGVVAEMAEALAPGRWVPVELALARIVAPERAQFQAYVGSRDLHRIAPGARGVFVAEDPSRRALPVGLSALRAINTPMLEAPYLASRHEGAISVAADTRHGLVPVQSQYRLLLDPAGPAPLPAPAQVTRGTIHLNAERVSALDRMWRMATSLVIRESGF